jgi:hypothetical protein
VTEDEMTLRDYFAAHALIGVLGARKGFLIDVGTDTAPEWAFQIADKMLAERKRTLAEEALADEDESHTSRPSGGRQDQ